MDGADVKPAARRLVSIFVFHEHNKSGKSDFVFADGVRPSNSNVISSRKFASRLTFISHFQSGLERLASVS